MGTNDTGELISVMSCAILLPTWPRGYKTFLCSAQLRLNLILLINVKMPKIVGIYKQDKLSLWRFKPEVSIYLGYFVINEQLKFYAQLS